MRLFRFLVVLAVLIALGYCGVLFHTVRQVPDHNTADTRFDTLIVLGTPAELDGTPSPEMRERVDEGVREYRAGVAPHIIMTGGAAHNTYVEAKVMADRAVSEGVPRSAVFVEGQAKNTIQNIWYSYKIMQENGWRSAEVISSPYHLPRTAMILQHYTGDFAMAWRTHAARQPAELTVAVRTRQLVHEAGGYVQMSLHGFPSNRYLPNS